MKNGIESEVEGGNMIRRGFALWRERAPRERVRSLGASTERARNYCLGSSSSANLEAKIDGKAHSGPKSGLLLFEL